MWRRRERRSLVLVLGVCVIGVCYEAYFMERGGVGRCREKEESQEVGGREESFHFMLTRDKTFGV